LSLVAIFREAEPLGDRRVEDPEGVREENAVEHLEAVSASGREEGRGEVAKAVHREDRCRLERRHEERARRVRLVMLDAVEPRAGRRAERAFELAANIPDSCCVLEPGMDVARARAE